jgi:hypothetical protein
MTAGVLLCCGFLAVTCLAKHLALGQFRCAPSLAPFPEGLAQAGSSSQAIWDYMIQFKGKR